MLINDLQIEPGMQVNEALDLVATLPFDRTVKLTQSAGAIKALAESRVRCGYKRIHILLRRHGSRTRGAPDHWAVKRAFAAQSSLAHSLMQEIESTILLNRSFHRLPG